MTIDDRIHGSFEAAVRQVDAGTSVHEAAAGLVAAMTVEEKLGCLDGDTDFWPGVADMVSGGYHRHAWPAAEVERLGIPGIRFVDGPRGCVVGAATCFPVSMARGATFDPSLEERIGEVIGREIRASGGTFTGAVCLNLLRHPGWGRAQETYGEEPYHVGEMAAALTRGLQRHVLACMKHFALNSMENARFTVDVSVDDRALHEVYLPHFKRVADEGVASVMAAYNSVNGQWCGDHPGLLTEILRDEWGWDGFVITDFMFGLRDPIGSVVAGCEIEMPFRQQRARVLADAVTEGRLDLAHVDRAVTRVVTTLLRFAHLLLSRPERSALATPDHRALAREAAVASTVMLRNDGALPLDRRRLRRVAVLGRLAVVPNLGDGGSSAVHPPDVVTLLDGVRAVATGVEVDHSEADVSVVRDADAIVVVVGCTKDDEGEYIGADAIGALSHLLPPMTQELTTAPEPGGGEGGTVPTETSGDSTVVGGGEGGGFSPGGDRRTLRLSESDERLIVRAVDQASAPVIVAVMGGSGIVMPWLDDVSACLQVWYPGMDGGHGFADVIFGDEEPGGRLPFALPRDEADLVDFDPDATAETYGLFHGHWHLDRTGVVPHRPFGFGQGYTSFDLHRASYDDGDVVRATVTNIGGRPGSTVVFVFGGLPTSSVERPRRRLVGFRRVHLDVGGTTDVAVPVDWAQLDVRLDGTWWTEPGDYRLEVGFHAGDARTTLTVSR